MNPYETWMVFPSWLLRFFDHPMNCRSRWLWWTAPASPTLADYARRSWAWRSWELLLWGQRNPAPWMVETVESLSWNKLNKPSTGAGFAGPSTVGKNFIELRNTWNSSEWVEIADGRIDTLFCASKIGGYKDVSCNLWPFLRRSEVNVYGLRI